MNKKTLELYSELLLASKKVEEHIISIELTTTIKPIIELDSFKLPLIFDCEALHPGTYKGWTFTKDIIKNAAQTIFMEDGNIVNWEVNTDHENNRKVSSMDNLIGKVIKSTYNDELDALILTCQISDPGMARKIYDKIARFVSIRINPLDVEFCDGLRMAKNIRFEEISIVRSPGDPKAKIIKIR